MLDKIIHVNSRNETLDFNSIGMYINSNSMRDYEWSVLSDNNRITGFEKGIVKKTIPFVFNVDYDKASELKNLFYEHFEIDVLNRQKGYFEINGYKYYCYLTKSVKSEYLINKSMLKLSIEVTTDEPYWIKEKTYSIDFLNATGETDALKYAFTYPFTYRGRESINIQNDAFIESNAIIRIFGYAENPMIKIGENVYQLNCTIKENEYVEIDTMNKTIYHYSSVGDKTNYFSTRNKEYDVFKPIPSGIANVSANEYFKIDIVIIESRGEPRWN